MKKLKLKQNGRTIEVYDWARKAAREIMECTVFTRMVLPNTKIDLYLAQVITDAFDGSKE